MKIKQRALALILSAIMVLTFMPAMAFAGALPEETEGVKWSITNDETVFFMEGNSQVLQVTTTLDGTGADLSYQWYLGEDNDGMDWNIIPGETGSSFVANSRGFYACAVTSNGETLVIPFSVFKENDSDEEDEEPELSTEWYVESEGDSFLINGKAILEVMPEYYGSDDPEFTYKWFECKYDEASDSWTDTEIAGATTGSYTATKGGDYRCDVTIKVNGEEDTRSISFTVCSWRILNSDGEYPVEYGKSATLTVETDYTGTDMTYQWYRYEYDPESGDDEKVAIEGATQKDYTVNNVTQSEFLTCVVEADGHSQEADFDIYIDTSKYEYQVTYPDATATYTPKDGRILKFKYLDHREWSMNFPREGDIITVKYDNKTTIYTCNDEDGEYFESDSGEKLYFNYNYEMVMNSNNQKEWVYTDSKTNHNEKRIVTKFDIEMEVPIEVTSHVKSINFEPENINLSTEDVKVTDDSGDSWYSFNKRAEYTREDGTTWTSWWEDGDKMTVDYNSGSSRVYTFDSKEEAFIWKDDYRTLVAYPSVLNDELSQGSNTIKVWFDGATADVEVYLGAGHMHNLVYTGAKAATCSENGNAEYWSCKGCGKYFSDAEGKTEITKDSWVIKALGHNLTAHAAKAATEAAEGNSAYWSCNKCGKFFSDKDCKTEIAQNSWVIPKIKPAEPSEEEKAAAQNDYLEWNGTLSGAVPAVKSVKAKAAKKKVTVNWKKADKKKLKKFDKVEIQVCPDKGFARANTIRKEVKKSKKSIKIKLQSKKTYYVRVRNVKGSGTTKLVSKWSRWKKVKIK